MKKEININEDYVAESTIDIWSEDNIKDYFNNGILIDMYTSSAAVKYAVYEDDDWYISDTINKD